MEEQSSRWPGLTSTAAQTMEELGNFGPTIRVGDRLAKGYTLDSEGDAGKTYWTSAEMRVMAAHLIETADWLDKRAGETKSNWD